MSDIRESLNSAVSKLQQERDELKLQMHMGSMAAKDEYDRVSGKVDELSDLYAPVKDAAEESVENVFAALGLVASELTAGFHRVRKSLNDEQDRESLSE